MLEDIGFGKFQMLAYAAIGFGINCTGYWFYILGYLYQAPAFSCEMTPDHLARSEEICTQANICKGDNRIIHWQIDEDADNTLYNWRQKLHIDPCEETWKLSFIASAFMLGWGATLLWVPSLADKLGRKPVFAFGNVLSTLMFSVLMVTESLDATIFASFVLGMLSSTCVNVGYVYLTELMPESKKVTLGSFWNIFEGSIYVLATFYFW